MAHQKTEYLPRKARVKTFFENSCMKFESPLGGTVTVPGSIVAMVPTLLPLLSAAVSASSTPSEFCGFDNIFGAGAPPYYVAYTLDAAAASNAPAAAGGGGGSADAPAAAAPIEIDGNLNDPAWLEVSNHANALRFAVDAGAAGSRVRPSQQAVRAAVPASHTCMLPPPPPPP
eukprot:COSAG06_NODE_21097_length_769_cov_1.661194_1_plen_172_part_01